MFLDLVDLGAPAGRSVRGEDRHVCFEEHAADLRPEKAAIQHLEPVGDVGAQDVALNEHRPAGPVPLDIRQRVLQVVRFCKLMRDELGLQFVRTAKDRGEP